MARRDRPIRRVGVGGRTEEYRPNDLGPEQAEQVIAREPVEWLYVYDPNDRQVARFCGTVDQVDLSDELKARTGTHGLYGESVIKDHLIVHNHPPGIGSDPVASFPPSSTDLAMMVERDLRALVVVSGGIRYEVRRPGLVWPLAEDLFVGTLADINAELDTAEDEFELTPRGSVERQRRVLERLRAMGVIEYQRPPDASGGL